MESIFDGNWLLLINLLIEGGIAKLGYAMYKGYKKQEAEKAKQREEYTKAMQEALCSLIRSELRRICLKAENRGFIYIYEAENINLMLPAYEKTGGNGTTKQMCEAALALPHKRKEE